MKFVLSTILLAVILLTACGSPATSTPPVIFSDFHTTITPPYENCVANASHTPSEPPGSIKILETGFSNATSSCDAQRGVINYSVVAFGGKNGSIHEAPDQEATASGDMSIKFKSPFTGNLRIEVTLTVNSKAGAAAGSATALPDFQDVVLVFIPLKHLGEFLDIAKVLIFETFAGLRTDAYLSVDTGTFQNKVSTPVAGHGWGASFPIAPNSQNETLDSKQVVISLTAPVSEEQTVLITTGISSEIKAYGWATAYWNPRNEQESFVTSVSLTGEFLSANPPIPPQQIPEQAQKPLATATFTLTPISTPTSTSTNTPTIMLTDTLTPTNTLSPVSSLRGTVLQRANCRYGPDAPYLYKYGLREGTKMEIIGRDADGNWLHIQAIGGNNPCWINGKLVQVDGDIMNLPDEYSTNMGLPISDDFEQITITSISPDASGVTVEWLPHTIRSDLIEEGAVEYIVEVWTCVDGKPAFYAIGTDDTFATIQIDNSCGIISHADVIGQDQHGFSPPAVIALP